MRRENESLIVESLSVSFADEDPPLEVFQSVSLVARPGEILGLFGSNGCGKTTLLRTIGGLKQPTAGRVCLPSAASDGHYLAVLPQNYRASFFNWTNLSRNIRLTLPGPIRNRRQHLARIEHVKEACGIELDLRLRPRACSGGMLQQAAIIRAFASRPKVLLADEPFSALDVNVAGKLRRAFVRLVRDEAIVALVVLHDLEDIVEVCNRVLVIPKLPFSTESLPGYQHAKVIENINVGKADDGLRSLSFVEIAERFLGEGPQAAQSRQ